MSKRLAAAGLAAGLAAGTGAGLVFGLPGFAGAQEDSTTTTEASSSTGSDTTDSTDTTDAEDTTDAAETGDRRGDFLEDALQPLIDDGTITQAQADAVIAALEEARPARGGGHGGRGGPVLDSAAEALGMTEDELRDALTDGSTLAEVATQEGVEVQTVIDALVADLETHLDEEVSEGDLTQAEADERLADAEERITEMVNEGPQGGGFGPGGRHRGGFGG